MTFDVGFEVSAGKKQKTKLGAFPPKERAYTKDWFLSLLHELLCSKFEF